jgi:hypothetical protein
MTFERDSKVFCGGSAAVRPKMNRRTREAIDKYGVAAVVRRFKCGGCGGPRKPAEYPRCGGCAAVCGGSPHTPYSPCGRFGERRRAIGVSNVSRINTMGRGFISHTQPELVNRHSFHAENFCPGKIIKRVSGTLRKPLILQVNLILVVQAKNTFGEPSTRRIENEQYQQDKSRFD